jgi:hypothetical protein
MDAKLIWQTLRDALTTSLSVSKQPSMPSQMGVHDGASDVASLRGGERQKQILFYIFLFFYILLDPYIPLFNFWTT